MSKDPVCGMDVEEKDAAGASNYKGKTYYFCSRGCKEKFDSSPESFLEQEEKRGSDQDETRPPEHLSEVGIEKSEPETPLKLERIDLPIVGMSCASCASTIQKGLAGLKGVDRANVKFASSKATVFFQPLLSTPSDLISSVKSSGYEVGTATVDIPIQGLKFASCVQKVEKALLQVKGVIKASVNLATERARVEYIPAEINFKW